MLSLARNGYTAAQVTAALQAADGSRTLAYRWDLLDATNAYLRALPNVIAGSGQVTLDTTATLQRTCALSVIDDPTINWLTSRIRPWARVLMSDGGYAEFPLGVFLVSTPTQQRDPKGGYFTRKISGYDQTQVLTDWRTTDRYAVASGTAYTSAMTTLLSAAGFAASQTNVAPSALTLPATREWDGGTPYLQILNDLCAAINYDPIWFDALGVVQGQAAVLASARPSLWTYTADATSVIVPGIEREYDLFNVPNVFVLVVSDPTRTVLRSVYTNSNPLSPTSTVNRGRQITKYDTSQTAPDQTTLDALAAAAAFSASQVYETITLPTLVMPMHEHNDVITVVYPALGIATAYLETGWSLTMKEGATMSHTLKRVVPV